jgi:hypothetical protein
MVFGYTRGAAMSEQRNVTHETASHASSTFFQRLAIPTLKAVFDFTCLLSTQQ